MSKSDRRAALKVVADYHATQLAELVGHVGEAVDRFRAGDIDAFDADQALFQYSRAAKELWKFCNGTDVEFKACLIDEGSTGRLVGTGRAEAAMTILRPLHLFRPARCQPRSDGPAVAGRALPARRTHRH